MKAVVQRVKSSSVSVDNEIVGSIDKGLMVLVGVCSDDTKKTWNILREKLNLRDFDTGRCDEFVAFG